MKIFRKKNEVPSDIDDAIHDAHAYLKGEDDDSEQYVKTIDNLAKLYKMKESLGTPDQVSKDAIITASASVGSILLILLFEGVGRGIITSKSLGFVPKLKVGR